MVKFYCVSCGAPVQIDASDAKVRRTKNGRHQLVAKCKCGTKVYRFIKESDVSKYKSGRSPSRSRSKKSRRSASRSKKSRKSRSRKSKSRRCPKGSHKRKRYSRSHRSRCVRN